MSRAAQGGVDIIFVDDEAIASMAGAYRGSPRPTDVLAFCYGDAPPCGGGDVPRAEVYVSVDTARRQAMERGVPLSHELVLLCVHGLLHVGGMDDEEPAAWRAMKRAEFETVMRIL